MQTVLITLIGPVRRIDLKLPAEVPVGDLFPKLLDLCVPRQAQQRAAISQWRLVLQPRGLAIPPNRSLNDCGVVDGAVLALQDGASFLAQQQEQEAARPFRPQGVQPGVNTGGIGVKWNIPNS